MRRLVTYARDGVAPATAELDLAALLPHAYCNTGPLLATLSFWVHTPYVRPDPEDPGGGWNIDLLWLDPVNRERMLFGTPISLNEGDAHFVSPMTQINRKAGGSMLKAMLSGSNVGTSLVSYRIVFLPSVLGDLIWLP